MKCLNVTGSLAGRFSASAPSPTAQIPKPSTASHVETYGHEGLLRMLCALSLSRDLALNTPPFPPLPGEQSREP
jgi:hypothetical protein